MLCEKCGGEMEYFQEDSSCGMTCLKCGWGWATTYIDPIFNDETIYTVFLKADNIATTTALRTLSDILECNFIGAKKAIDSAPIQLISDKAYNIKETLSKLKKANIKFDVKPDFSYEI